MLIKVKDTAQDVYKTAWQQYLLTEDEEGKRRLEQLMDACQPYCVSNGKPGPEWEAFVDTLPGYHEYMITFQTSLGIIKGEIN